MEAKELNEKLLKFAGFTYIRDVKFETDRDKVTALYPKGSEIEGYRDYAPNLVHSLDAQAKWLYPPLFAMTNIKIDSIIFEKENDKYLACIQYWAKNKERDTYGVSVACERDETPAKAFALVVEKLIDSTEG